MDYHEYGEGASKSKILTIMVVDIAGYTRITAGLGRKTFDELHNVFDRITTNVCSKYGGWIVKKVGDSFIVVFESANDCLYCASELQERFEETNKSTKSKNPIRIKIAVNTGEVIIKDNDIYGDAVNLAAKLEKLTKPGEIYFTQAVYLAMNKNEVSYQYLGTRRIKGFGYPIKIFKVRRIHEEGIEKWVFLKRVTWKIFKFLLMVAALAAIGWLVYNNQSLILSWIDRFYGWAYELVARNIDKLR